MIPVYDFSGVPSYIEREQLIAMLQNYALSSMVLKAKGHSEVMVFDVVRPEYSALPKETDASLSYYWNIVVDEYHSMMKSGLLVTENQCNFQPIPDSLRKEEMQQIETTFESECFLEQTEGRYPVNHYTLDNRDFHTSTNDILIAVQYYDGDLIIKTVSQEDDQSGVSRTVEISTIDGALNIKLASTIDPDGLDIQVSQDGTVSMVDENHSSESILSSPANMQTTKL